MLATLEKSRAVDQVVGETRCPDVRRPRSKPRANETLTPIGSMPAASLHSQAVSRVTSKSILPENNLLRASGALSSKQDLPAQSSEAGSGQNDHVTLGRLAAPDLNGIVDEIRKRGRERSRVIAAQMAIDSNCRAHVRCHMGWEYGLPEAQRTEMNERAAKLIAAILAGKPFDSDVRDDVTPYVLMAEGAAKLYRTHRGLQEKEMERLAKLLPAAAFVESVKGLGYLGLAIIVGETGNLSNYDNPAKVWKRLGLAPHNGKSAARWRVDGGLSSEEWSVLGYSPRRRSACWTIADSLLRQKNIYADLYRERKEYEIRNHPEFLRSRGEDGKPKTTKACDMRARRYAEKRMILHLWRAWRDAAGKESP